MYDTLETLTTLLSVLSEILCFVIPSFTTLFIKVEHVVDFGIHCIVLQHMVNTSRNQDETSVNFIN